MPRLALRLPFNRMELRDPEIGIITSGVCYNYVREVLPEASTLKLGLVYPLAKDLIREFAERVKTLYVVEELDPFIEDQVKAMGIVPGKDIFSLCGELTPGGLHLSLAPGAPRPTAAGNLSSCRRARPTCAPAVRTAASSSP